MVTGLGFLVATTRNNGTCSYKQCQLKGLAGLVICVIVMCMSVFAWLAMFNLLSTCVGIPTDLFVSIVPIVLAH